MNTGLGERVHSIIDIPSAQTEKEDSLYWKLAFAQLDMIMMASVISAILNVEARFVWNRNIWSVLRWMQPVVFVFNATISLYSFAWVGWGEELNITPLPLWFVVPVWWVSLTWLGFAPWWKLKGERWLMEG